MGEDIDLRTVFDEDVEAYEKLLLSERGLPSARVKAEAKPKPKRVSAAEQRKLLAPLQADLTKAEERVAKIEDMRDKIDARLADPSFYTTDDSSKIEALNVKRGEILEALDRAEAIWMAAQEKLDAEKERL